MAPLPKSSRGRQALDSAVRRLNTKYQKASEPITATIAGRNLIAHQGRLLPADVDGDVGDTVTVYNIGSAANARYSTTPQAQSAGSRSRSSSANSTGGRITPSSIGGGSLGPHKLADKTIHEGPLDVSQAPWAFHLDGRRTITGNVKLAANITVDGMDPSAHIANTDSDDWTHHEPAESGDGIVISSVGQVVSLNRAAQSGLEFVTESSASKLRVATGFGLSFQTGGNALQVDAYSDAVANPGKVLKTDASAGARLGYVSTPLVRTVGTEENLVIQSTGNIELKPVGSTGALPAETYEEPVVWMANNGTLSTYDFISGFQNPGWAITPTVADFPKIIADEAHFQAVIFDIVRAQAGSSRLTKSLAELSQNFTAPAAVGSSATLYVHDLPGFNNVQVFEDDDWVELQVISFGVSGDEFIVAKIWGQVSNYVDLADGEQSWTFTMRQGTPGQVAYAGSIATDWGQSGDGYIYNTVLDPSGSPYMDIGTWSGANPYNTANRSVHMRVGNLDGMPGLSKQFGLYTKHVSGTDTRYLLLSDQNFEASGLSLSMKSLNTGNETIRLDPDFLYLAMGDPIPTDFTFLGPSGMSGIFMGQVGGEEYYDFFAGDYDASNYIHWDASAGTMTIRGTLLLPDGTSPGTGVNPRGVWNATIAYAVNDLVDYGGTSYLCNTAHTSTSGSGITGTPNQSAYWNAFAQSGNDGSTGTSWRTRGTWSGSSVAYVNDSTYIDIVSYNGAVYYCTTSHTSATSGANGPPTVGTNWLQLAPAGADGATGPAGEQGTSYRPRGAWQQSTSYVRDTVTIDTVEYGGSTYYCLSSHISNTTNANGNGPPGVGTRWNLLASRGEQGPAGSDNQDISFLYDGTVSQFLASLPSADRPYSGLALTNQLMGHFRNDEPYSYIDNQGNLSMGGSSGSRIFYNASTGKFGGINAAGVTQWWSSSVDGKFYAGGGALTVDQLGLTINSGDVVLSDAGIKVATQSGAGGTGGFFRYYDSGGTQRARMAFAYSPGIIKEWLFTHNNGNGIFRFESGAVVVSQSITAGQGIVSTGSSNVDGLLVNMPANTNAEALYVRYNGADRAHIRPRAASNDIFLPEVTLGNNNAGSGIFLGRNLSSGGAGNAPAFLGLMRANGQYTYIWSDNQGRIRRGSQRPTGSTSAATVNSETAGTIIG